VYPEKITRGAAINTIKRWVPDMQPMDSLIREFALKLLRRLQSPRSNTERMDVDTGATGTEDNMEDGQLPTEALIKTPYLSSTLQLPAERSQVLQHVELMFALTVKVPEFLDESVIFIFTRTNSFT
jgi:symplekin